MLSAFSGVYDTGNHNIWKLTFILQYSIRKHVFAITQTVKRPTIARIVCIVESMLCGLLLLSYNAFAELFRHVPLYMLKKDLSFVSKYGSLRLLANQF